MNLSLSPTWTRACSSELQKFCGRSGQALSRNSIARSQGEKGAGSLKAIIWTAILVAVVFVGFKVTPLLVSNYEFQDGIQTIARMASVNRPTAEKIRQSVLQEAEKDELLIAPEDIHVEAAGGNIQISADYSTVVDLKVYQWTLNFHPTASNHSLF
ncbi:MAG: DUF4845 domain-containing protein [Acidobacteriia bacterium]|nr:DUF4845 domain-containing protein [Terriglobia bacterium]